MDRKGGGREEETDKDRNATRKIEKLRVEEREKDCKEREKWETFVIVCVYFI